MLTSDTTRTPRLLIIDDEIIVGKRLLQVFGKMGFEVEVFTSGAPALAALAERAFDVVVTDLKMADMDGMAVLAQVRQSSPATQVIIITGYALPETAEEAFRLGVFEFITKPFRLDELKQVILRALAKP